MPDLKNCPMCGSDRVDIITGNFVSATDDFKAGQSFAKVWCKRCQVRTGPEKSKSKAAAAWNRRSQPEGMVSVPRDLIEEMASDIEAEVRERYVHDGIIHPAQQRHYARDMDVVKRAREALERGEG